MTSAVADAYSRSSASWADGPATIYSVLAQRLIDDTVLVPGELALDVGSGTGVASRALAARGLEVVALDVATGMLVGAPCGVLADAMHLPFARWSFDVVVAACSLNHVVDHVGALREAGRVLRPGGRLVASVYAADDEHPVKAAMDEALAELGWSVPEWYVALRDGPMRALATVERADAALAAAGLDGEVEHVVVALGTLSPERLLAWREGLAHIAPFVAALDPAARRRLLARAGELLGPHPPPLVRRMVVLRARSSMSSDSRQPASARDRRSRRPASSHRSIAM